MPASEVPVVLPVPADLALRCAGHAVIEKLLEVHQGTRPRGRLARFFGVSPLTPEGRPWYLGAVGERIVGRMLAGLDERWAVLHAVPVGSGDSDIDHVVIGPGGVFTINTKHHSGQSVWVAPRTFLVAGQAKSYLPESRKEAERATRLLGDALPAGLGAHPLIAVVDAKSLTIRERPVDVTVMNANGLVRWLHKRPPVLDAQQIATLTAVAQRPTTWHSQPKSSMETTEVQRRFGALRSDVRAAKRVRIAWAVALLLGFLAVVAVTGPPLITWMLQLLASMGASAFAQ